MNYCHKEPHLRFCSSRIFISTSTVAEKEVLMEGNFSKIFLGIFQEFSKNPLHGKSFSDFFQNPLILISFT